MCNEGNCPWYGSNLWYEIVLCCRSTRPAVGPELTELCNTHAWLSIFAWAIPNVSIHSYARFFSRLVLHMNGSESSERMNVWVLRVVKAAQITWHTKDGQRSSRFHWSGQRRSRFILSVRLNMYQVFFCNKHFNDVQVGSWIRNFQFFVMML